MMHDLFKVLFLAHMLLAAASPALAGGPLNFLFLGGDGAQEHPKLLARPDVVLYKKAQIKE